MGNEAPKPDMPEEFKVKPENVIPEVTIYGDPNAKLEEEAESIQSEAADAIDQENEGVTLTVAGPLDKPAASPTLTYEQMRAGVRAVLRKDNISAEQVQQLMGKIDRSTQEGQWQYRAAEEVYQEKSKQASNGKPWYKFWG